MYPLLLEEAQRGVKHSDDVQPRITVSAQDMPLPEFSRYVANQTGVSIVLEENLDRVRVNVEATDQAADELLSAIARRSGVQVTRTGTLFFLGSLRKEDKGVLVRRVRRLSEAELQAAVEPFLSEFGGSTAFADGLLVVGDRVEVLERIHELLDAIEAAESAVWVVQFYLVSLSEADVKEMGIETTGSLNLATSLAAVAQGNVQSSAVALGTLDSLITYARARSSTAVVAEPLFYLSDGEQARMFRGERIPIETIEVREFGDEQREAVEFEYVDTGLEFRVALREVGPKAARLDLTTQISSVAGEAANGAPIFSQESYDSHCLVTSGGVYLVGAIERQDMGRANAFGLANAGKRSRERRLLHVWARCQKVDPRLVTGSSSLLSRIPEPTK